MTEKKLRPLYVLRQVQIPWSQLKKGDVFRNEGAAPGDKHADSEQWNLAKGDSFPDEGGVWGVHLDYLNLTYSSYKTGDGGSFRAGDIPKDDFREKIKQLLLSYPAPDDKEGLGLELAMLHRELMGESHDQGPDKDDQ